MWSPAGSRSSNPLISDLLTLFSCLFIFFFARLLFHVTKDTNVQTTDVGNIYYLSKERAFPGIKEAQSCGAVPRIGGLKISLFIMEANQISVAVCLQAKEIWKCAER